MGEKKQAGIAIMIVISISVVFSGVYYLGLPSLQQEPLVITNNSTENNNTDNNGGVISNKTCTCKLVHH